MLQKLSILALCGLAAALWFVTPVYADGVPAHLAGDLERYDDSAPGYWQYVRIGENFMLNVDRFSTFERDVFEDADSDSSHSIHAVINTAEWIWWLNHSDTDKKEVGKDPVDPPVPTPEPASLFLLGSGVLALGAWRRRANHSAPVS